jgi:hypothetical protein
VPRGSSASAAGDAPIGELAREFFIDASPLQRERQAHAQHSGARHGI